MPWQPACSLEALKARAVCNAQIRAFFLARSVLEVETPIMNASTATDPQLASIHALADQTASPLYLHTSPEFPMKRLLAAGSGDIYQLCKTFRRAEQGTRHNPEFTMLEWYRLDFSLEDLMQEVADLALEVLKQPFEIEMLSYHEAFEHHLGINPFTVCIENLFDLCALHCAYSANDLSRDDALNLLLASCIEPKLGQDRMTFLHSYPASQASLAQVYEDGSGHRVAKRFELYMDGLELANGYQELTDPFEQRRRFIADNAERSALDLEQIPLDEYFLQALEHGMPACAGVALGVDRLLMVQARTKKISDVLAFPVDRI